MAVSFNNIRYFRRKNEQKISQDFMDLPETEVNENLQLVRGIGPRKTMNISASCEYIRMLSRIT